MRLLRVLCAGCSFTVGCSALFVNAPPDEVPKGVEPPCTTSRAAPIVDTVIGGLQAVRTGAAALVDDSVYRDAPISREADIAIGTLLTVTFVASAVHGFGATSRCSELKSEARMRSEQPAPRPAVFVRPAAPTRGPPRTPPPAQTECGHDAQCGGTRICEQGRCKEFSPAP
jgi:hypothetical protein